MAKKSTNKTTRTAATRTNARKNNAFGARNNREKKMIIAIALLAIALIGSIGVAVAAFSTDLQINGTATVKSTVWDVHFQNLATMQKGGSDKIKEVTAPTIKDNANGTKSTVIGDYKVELKEPGDWVEYDFEVINAGDLDAEITQIVMSSDIATSPKQITCTTVYADNDPDKGTESATEKKAREDKVCNNIEYTLQYAATGADVAVGDKLPKSTGPNDTNNIKKLKLKLSLKSTMDASDLPDKDVEITGLGITITYGQDTSI